MAKSTYSATQLLTATGSGSSWTADGGARQDTYGKGSIRCTGAIRFEGLAGLALDNISISKIEMTLTFGEHGTEGKKYLYLREALKNEISGATAGMRGEEIGSPLLDKAYDNDVTLSFDASTNSAMFAKLRAYIMGGGQTLILYTGTTRKVYSGTYTAGYDYLGVEAASIAITYTYLRSSGSIGSASTGSAAKLTIKASSSAFTHKVTWKIGSNSASQTVGAGVKSASYTIPHSWIPNAASATATVVLETFSGSTSLGSVSYNFTVTVPASLVPTIDALNIAPAYLSGVAARAQSWGLFLQNKSTAVVSMSGVYAHGGATMASYSITTSPNIGSASDRNWTTGTLTRSGNITFTAKLTDSRGRTATKSTTIYVNAYQAPWFGAVPTLFRCTSTGSRDDLGGTYARVMASFSCSSVNGNNSVRCAVTLNGASTSLANVTAYTIGAGALELDGQYVAQLTLTDDVGESTVYSLPLPSAAYLFHVRRGGKSIGVGRAAGTSDDKVIHVGWPVALDTPLAPESGGTGLTASPSILVNLEATAAANVLQASPRPGVTGTLPIGKGGTGLTASPSILVNLEGTGAANVMQASPRPGVTGTLGAGHGGTGHTSLQATRNAMGLGNTTGALPAANGGTGNAYGMAAGLSRSAISDLNAIGQINHGGLYAVGTISLGSNAPSEGNFIVLALSNDWTGTEGASGTYMRWGVLLAFTDRATDKFYICKVDTDSGTYTWSSIT